MSILQRLFSKKEEKEFMENFTIKNEIYIPESRNEWILFAAVTLSRLIRSVSFTVDQRYNYLFRTKNFKNSLDVLLKKYLITGKGALYIENFGLTPKSFHVAKDNVFSKWYTQQYSEYMEGLVYLMELDEHGNPISAQRAIERNKENVKLMKEIQNKNFRKGGQPFGVVEIDQNHPDSMMGDFYDNLRTKGDMRNGNYLILKNGAKCGYKDYHQYDRVYLDYYKHNRDDLLLYSFIFPEILKSDSKELKRTYNAFVIFPLLKHIQDAFNLTFKGFGRELNFQFDFSELDASYEDSYLVTRIISNLNRCIDKCEDDEIRKAIKEKILKYTSIL